MERDFKLFLFDILDSIQVIEKYVEHKTEDDFLEDGILQDAIIRRIEIIGEAVKNIPEQIKQTYPDVAWKKSAGMRDVVIHGYFEVDVGIAWDTIHDDLPILKEQIAHIMKELSTEQTDD